MNTESIVFLTTAADITQLAQEIINAQNTETGGRSTYLRSLLAGIQIELCGKAIVRGVKAPKAPKVEDALNALEKVNAVYYEAVLLAVPEKLGALERNAMTSFARSSASTLRGAIRAGWNPLSDLQKVSKVILRRYIDEHRPPRTPSPKVIQRQVTRLTARIQALLEQLTDESDAGALRGAIAGELGIETHEPEEASPPRRENRIERVQMHPRH